MRLLSHSVVPHPLQPHGLSPTSLLCPWGFIVKDTRPGCHFLLQRFFLTQGSNPISCIGRWILYHCTTWEAHLFKQLFSSPLNSWRSGGPRSYSKLKSYSGQDRPWTQVCLPPQLMLSAIIRTLLHQRRAGKSAHGRGESRYGWSPHTWAGLCKSPPAMAFIIWRARSIRWRLLWVKHCWLTFTDMKTEGHVWLQPLKTRVSLSYCLLRFFLSCLSEPQFAHL